MGSELSGEHEFVPPTSSASFSSPVFHVLKMEISLSDAPWSFHFNALQIKNIRKADREPETKKLINKSWKTRVFCLRWLGISIKKKWRY